MLLFQNHLKRDDASQHHKNELMRRIFLQVDFYFLVIHSQKSKKLGLLAAVKKSRVSQSFFIIKWTMMSDMKL